MFEVGGILTRKMWRFSCVIMVLFFMLDRCYGSGSFGFDIHHMFSDPVKAMLNFDGDDQLPEMGTVDLYTAMVHRDRLFHGRRLAGDSPDLTSLTFAGGNLTSRIPFLGYLYYANVSVGTPASWYLVALDTGSDLFWLPCDCTPNCAKALQLSPTSEKLKLNIYSLKTSSTGRKHSCLSPSSTCSYSISYLSVNTSSSGYLVEDVLHLTTDANPFTPMDPHITFGCGVNQTGSFLNKAAPNGLLGLGMEDIAVPTILARNNLTANSFSMCFTKGGVGRISFGDKGSKNQSETPLNPDPFSLYNVSITHISVGTNVSAMTFTAFFDTGASFTLLTEPAYTLISEKFDSQVKDRRMNPSLNIPFKYCYLTSSRQNDWRVPAINLTMEGGHQFTVKQPTIEVGFQDGNRIYCLGVLKSSELDLEKDVNVIGENFMTGYRVVFDREKMVLGWKASDCDEAATAGTYIPGNKQPSTSDAPSSLRRYSHLIVITLLIQYLFVPPFHSSCW